MFFNFCIIFILLLAISELSFGVPIPSWLHNQQPVVFHDRPIIKESFETNHHHDGRVDHRRHKPDALYDDSIAGVTRSMAVLSHLTDIDSSVIEARMSKEAYHQLMQSTTSKPGNVMHVSNADKPWYFRWLSWSDGKPSGFTSECRFKVPVGKDDNSKSVPPRSIFGDRHQHGISSQVRSAKNDAVMQVITSDVMF